MQTNLRAFLALAALAMFLPVYAQETQEELHTRLGIPTSTNVAVTTGVGSEVVLASSQSGRLISNAGTSVKGSVKLPDAPPVCTYYDVVCVDADLLRVVANTGDTIALPHGTSASGGYVELISIGSGFRLTATTPTTWVATNLTGTMRRDSTTSAGFAYTPTAWTTETFTGSWSTNTTYAGKSRQVGNVREFWVQVTTSGTPTTAALTINLPSTWAADETLMAATSHEVASGHANDSGAIWSLQGLYVMASNVIRVMKTSSSSAATDVTQAAPFSFAAGDLVTLRGSIPVQ